VDISPAVVSDLKVMASRRDDGVRDAIAILIVGSVIVTLGTAAIIVHAFRRRSRERFLLWFGLFSISYGMVLVIRNEVFRIGFGNPGVVGLSLERLISLATIIPGILLFEEFYGFGWRASIRWLLVIYSAVSVVAIVGMVSPLHLTLILPPGVVLVIMVPVVLVVGRLAGYKPPAVPNSPVLFTGLIGFFAAFSLDRVLQTSFTRWHTGLEPYGFLVLVVCLGYVTFQRVVADERSLVSLRDEMRAAKTIQEALLPRTVPSVGNLQIAARYAPMTDVAGDLYDFPAVSANQVDLLVADVMGHGVPAALVASMVKVAVSTTRERTHEPANIIAGLNNTLCNEARAQYATAVYMHLDAATRVCRYASAAHPPGLVWRRGRQELEKLDGEGLLLGVRPNESYDGHEVSFEAGDRLLLYSDGLVEAENGEGESFGDEALGAFIHQGQNLGTERFVDMLLDSVLDWSRSGSTKGQEDDITILVVDIQDGSEASPMSVLSRNLQGMPSASSHASQRSSDLGPSREN
jgi:sigma-B regulation protein RsbU (phosphoserine phosphatase)